MTDLESNRKPVVSVVVPAFNAAATIEVVLLALFQQEFDLPYEVIVVDDGSSDMTREKVLSFKQVRYVFQNNAGPAAARNHGAREAKGRILCFTDSDCRAHPDWLEKVTKPLLEQVDRVLSQTPQQVSYPGWGRETAHRPFLMVAAVAGSYGIANSKSWLARMIHQEILFRHQRLPQDIRAFGSYNVGILKSVFDQVGGFNEIYRRASGEDNDLSYRFLRKGYKIRFEPQALVDHFHPQRPVKYLQEQFRHGYWRSQMYVDHPQMLGGDDYTFWKDSFEIFLVLLLFTFVPLALVIAAFRVLAWSIALLLLGIELIFGWRITRHMADGFAFGWVMFLRGFFRSFGLGCGLTARLFRFR